MDNLAKLVGKCFFINRKLQGLSCAAVAEKTGIQRSYISKIESGHTQISLARFVDLCNFYGLDPVTCLDGLIQESKTGMLDSTTVAIFPG